MFGRQHRKYKCPDSLYQYAGRYDLKAKYNGKIYILDFKTGTKPKDKEGYPEWALQTAAYRKADGEAKGNAIIHLDKESGLPTVFDYSETYMVDFERFRTLADYYILTYSDDLEEKEAFSVTTICRILDKPALMYWSANCACDYIIQEFPKMLYGDDLFPVVEAARKNWRKVSKKAMDIGAQVHDAIEMWLKNKIEPPKTVPDEVLSGFIAFLEWWEKNNIEVIKTEQVCYGRF